MTQAQAKEITRPGRVDEPWPERRSDGSSLLQHSEGNMTPAEEGQGSGAEGRSGGSELLPRGTLRPDLERLPEQETDQKIVPSKELCYLPPQPGRRKSQGRQNCWKLRPVLHMGRGCPLPLCAAGTTDEAQVIRKEC